MSAQWYIDNSLHHNSTQMPLNRIRYIRNLFCYNWGSVVGCAFMVGFLGVPDLIHLLVTPEPEKVDLNPCGRVCKSISAPFESISLYIREEALTYINLAGIPYCNASVCCESLNFESQIKRNKGSRPLVRVLVF